VRQHLVAMKIMVAGMIAGVLVFFVLSLLVLRPLAGAEGPRGWLVTSIALAVAAGTIAVRMVVPRLLVASGRRKILRGHFSARVQPARFLPTRGDLIKRTGDAGRLAILFMDKTITGCVLLEGATFFLLLAFVVEGQMLAMWSAAVLILVMVAHFPTHAGVVGWIQSQLDWLQRER
jgi:hypothetical protein